MLDPKELLELADRHEKYACQNAKDTFSPQGGINSSWRPAALEHFAISDHLRRVAHRLTLEAIDRG